MLTRVLVLGAALIAGLPLALFGALWLHKREVRFGPDGWRFGWHIASTPLARFPVVEPVAPPRFAQRLTSGWGDLLRVEYVSRADIRTVLAALAQACPDPPSPREDGFDLTCGAVLASVRPAGQLTAVTASLSE